MLNFMMKCNTMFIITLVVRVKSIRFLLAVKYAVAMDRNNHTIVNETV